MSDKENEVNNINQSEEFQTFSKNYKDSNKTKKKPKIFPLEENYEFTFKKNLFNEKNIKNENNIEESAHFYNEQNENNIKIKTKFCNHNYNENKNIFKELFKKNKNIKIDNNCNTVILSGIRDKTNKTLINTHNKNNKFIKTNKNNDKLKNTSSSFIHNDRLKSISSSFIHTNANDNKSPLINNYIKKIKKNINNSKDKINKNNKNNSFLCQKNQYNINKNNAISSYKSKYKKNISAKNIYTSKEFNTKKDFNQSIKNIKTSSQNSITYNFINKEKKKFEKNNLKICNKNDFHQKNKIHILKNGNKLLLNNNQKNINKIKIDKAPLSCKNQIINIFKKDNLDKSNRTNHNAYSNLNKAKKINSINKTSSAIALKKTNTFLYLKNKKKNCSMNKLNGQPKNKYTPDKNNKNHLVKKLNK